MCAGWFVVGRRIISGGGFRYGGCGARFRTSLLDSDLADSLLALHLCSSWKMKMPWVGNCSVVDSPAESRLVKYNGLLVALEMLRQASSVLSRWTRVKTYENVFHATSSLFGDFRLIRLLSGVWEMNAA